MATCVTKGGKGGKVGPALANYNKNWRKAERKRGKMGFLESGW